MSKIQTAFQRGKAFIGFVTAGDPSMEKTEEFILAMVSAGADLIEIGIPFSDPIAEGPVIQQANIRALSAGAKLSGIFSMVEGLRRKIETPLVFLTYFNPVFHLGCRRFFNECAKTEVDGIIIPDLPFEEQPEVRDAAASQGVEVISLIAPTSAQRIQRIAAEAEGFLYVVSSMGVTGIRQNIETDLEGIIKTARVTAKVPAAVGFGINTPKQAADIARFADGVIVGSAIVKIIAEHRDSAAPHLAEYVKTMKQAITR
ncbi:MAG: tryptophan synthase subunit alpha [Spirochaetaceae bacterium]|jgi:tryptophan synthase alpha chain|nr:tryptophan synthase subunit alpha [Spirochaetaceae bacterium]